MTATGSAPSWSPFVQVYDPLKAGSIDGTDLVPHDNAVTRAMCAEYNAPDERTVTSNPSQTLFVGRLNLRTSERQLNEEFSQYGSVKSCRVVKDIITGISRGYGFVEFKREADAQQAWRQAHSSIFHERQILVEWEFARTLPGWVPRRLGGGLGGKKESGQLRFGGRDRPFKKPLILPANQEQHHTLPDSNSSLKSYDGRERPKDSFSIREDEFSRAKPKFTRNEHNKKYWSGNHYNEGKSEYKRFNEDRLSSQCYSNEEGRRYKTHTEDKYLNRASYEEERRKYHKSSEGNSPDYVSYYHSGKKKFKSYDEESYQDQPYFEQDELKHRRHSQVKYSDQYSFGDDSKKYRKYQEDKYAEKSKYKKDYTDMNDKVVREDYDKRRNYDHKDSKKHSVRDYGSSSHYERERGKKQSKHYTQGEGMEQYTPDVGSRAFESEASRYKNKDDFDLMENGPVQKRKLERCSSTASSNSHLSNSKKKHKKSKHRKKRHHSDSSESDLSLGSESCKRHKKKKKKKKMKKEKKKKHSSEGEID